MIKDLSREIRRTNSDSKKGTQFILLNREMRKPKQKPYKRIKSAHFSAECKNEG